MTDRSRHMAAPRQWPSIQENKQSRRQQLPSVRDPRGTSRSPGPAWAQSAGDPQYTVHPAHLLIRQCTSVRLSASLCQLGTPGAITVLQSCPSLRGRPYHCTPDLHMMCVAACERMLCRLSARGPYAALSHVRCKGPAVLRATLASTSTPAASPSTVHVLLAAGEDLSRVTRWRF